MSYLQVNSSRILVPSQPNWEPNYGETTGYQILKTKPFLWPKVLSHSKSYQHKLLKPDGKTKDYHRTLCHSRTLQLFLHVQDGHFWLIHNFKDLTGLEVLKEITYHQLISIKSTGWENSLKIFLKVELSYWKVFNNKFKLPLILYFQELLSKKLEAIH